MDESKIISAIKGREISKDEIYRILSVQNNAEKKEIDDKINILIEGGIIYSHLGKLSLLKDRGMYLAKVVSKYNNYVLFSTVPDKEEIKISGKECDSYLIGDLLYLKAFSSTIYHAVDYLRQVTTLKGTYSYNRNGKAVLMVKGFTNCGKNIYVTDVEEGLHPELGDYILCDILSITKTLIQVKAKEILVKKDDVGYDISKIIISNDAPIIFSKEAIKEAEKIEDKITSEDKEGRTDYTGELVFTIDGDDSKDFDDAVSIKRELNGYLLRVHIADVTHYMRNNTALDKDAYERGTSLYVADRVVPMLPFELSDGICSLNPGKERLTLTCTMIIDAKGNIFSPKVERSFIISKGRLTYNKVNALFRGEECDYPEEIKKSLLIMKEASTLIRKRRERQGAMSLQSVELKFKVDENGIPYQVDKQISKEAEKMIEDFMIACNCSVAKLLKENDIPVLYRVHDNPPSDKIIAFKDFIRKIDPQLRNSFPKSDNITASSLNEFLNKITDDNLKYAINTMMLRAMAKARYSPEEVGHFGLAEEEYCHFTSPIRRYPDDIIHRLVKRYLLDKNNFSYSQLKNELKRVGEYLTDCEIRGDVIERTVDDLESCKYLQDKIGQVYHGRISSLQLRGMFVQTDIGIEGFLMYHCMHGNIYKFDEKRMQVKGKYEDGDHPVYHLGDEIDVCVINVDSEKILIDFSTPEFYKKHLEGKSDRQIKQIIKDGSRNERRADVRSTFPRKTFKREKEKKESLYEIVTDRYGFSKEVKKKRPTIKRKGRSSR